MARKRPPKVYGQGAIFLDPIDCGSTIRWKIVDGGWSEQPTPDCEISLTDCNRTITWNQDCTEEGIAKIDKAIKILTECRSIMKKNKFIKKDDNS